MSESEEGINRTSFIPFDNFRPQFHPNINIENSTKRVGMPPTHPHIPPLSPSSQTESLHNLTLGSGPSHSRTLSQPSFYSVDSLPPLSPCTFRENVASADHVVGDVSLPPGPPRKTHRRSSSDIPFGFLTILQSSPPLISLRGGSKGFDIKREITNVEGMGERKCEGEVVDDMFNSYMNLNNLGRLNTFRAENGEDLDSRASVTKVNKGDSSDNEATSSVIGSGNNMQMSGVSSVSDKREGIKRSAGGDIAPTTRHFRSVSMDSVMGKMNCIDESLKLPTSSGGQIGKVASGEAIDANADGFSLEFGNGVFNGEELKKIMANENLAEMALTDPKRVKRILANRQSAARSKERKMRYITELENKVQTLQNEATTLTAQLTLLQKDSTSLTSQNNELKFRLQAMEQQAHLRDALNEALTTEVQRLKLMAMELNGDAANFSQLSINPQMFQLHHQQEQQSQQQNGGVTTTSE